MISSWVFNIKFKMMKSFLAVSLLSVYAAEDKSSLKQSLDDMMVYFDGEGQKYDPEFYSNLTQCF